VRSVRQRVLKSNRSVAKPSANLWHIRYDGLGIARCNRCRLRNAIECLVHRRLILVCVLPVRNAQIAKEASLARERECSGEPERWLSVPIAVKMACQGPGPTRISYGTAMVPFIGLDPPMALAATLWSFD